MASKRCTAPVPRFGLVRGGTGSTSSRVRRTRILLLWFDARLVILVLFLVSDTAAGDVEGNRSIVAVFVSVAIQPLYSGWIRQCWGRRKRVVAYCCVSFSLPRWQQVKAGHVLSHRVEET
jgi:hypothetical protein